MQRHFNDELFNECRIMKSTYFKKLGKSSDTASQPGQRQRPLTNKALVPSGMLEGTEMSQ